MNICVLSPSYPTSKTIVFVFVDQLCKALADKGESITIIAPQSVTRCLVRNEPFSPLHSVIYSSRGNKIDLYRPLTFTAGNGYFKFITSLSFKLAVRRAFRKLKSKPDICYGHFWGAISTLYPLAKKNNIPLFGASGEENVALYDNYSLSDKKEINSYLSGLISVSTKNKEECLSLGLITEDKVKVVPNAINLSLFKGINKQQYRQRLGIKDSDFVVGFLGQFVPRKGDLRLAQALCELNDRNIKAMFIGSGSENPIYDRIIFKGRLDHNDIPKYLTACDVFVLPTENEGCSNAIIEAMACGLPIISTDAPFNYDILNDSNSILIDCHNIEQIKEAILRLKKNPLLREQLSKGALEKANMLSLENRAEVILSFIKERM